MNSDKQTVPTLTCCNADTFSSSMTANCVTEWSRLPPLNRWLEPHPDDVRKFDLRLVFADPVVAMPALPILRRLQCPSKNDNKNERIKWIISQMYISGEFFLKILIEIIQLWIQNTPVTYYPCKVINSMDTIEIYILLFYSYS